MIPPPLIHNPLTSTSKDVSNGNYFSVIPVTLINSGADVPAPLNVNVNFTRIPFIDLLSSSQYFDIVPDFAIDFVDTNQTFASSLPLPLKTYTALLPVDNIY